MQTEYSNDAPIYRLGCKVDSRTLSHVPSKAADGPIKAGYGVFRSPGYGSAGPTTVDPGQVYQQANPVPAADVDAILATGGASSASIQTLDTAAELNGAIGLGDMRPARNITLVLSNHTDWDATNATLNYIDENGETQAETLAIPNGGNATVTSTAKVVSVISLVIPAQTGAGGTFTIGVSALDASVTITDFEGVALSQMWRESALAGSDSLSEYADGDTVPCMYKGSVAVLAELACEAGDPVYCRFAGTGTQGAFSNAADGSNNFLITGARWERKTAAGALGPIALY